jgi:micrococcal nuclease
VPKARFFICDCPASKGILSVLKLIGKVSPMRPNWQASSALLLALCLLPVDALADPCDLIPERGPMPAEVRSGQVFSGPVTYVGDGDSLCVALGPSHTQWAEVRLADFYAPELHDAGGPEAKDTLSRLVEGKKVECVAEHRSYDRVVAVCRLRGRSVGDLMRSAGVEEGGRGKQ